jgi:hypothetical protein
MRQMGNPIGECPPKLHDLTEAIAVAVDRGWLVNQGDSVCLTDAGRDLVKNR